MYTATNCMGSIIQYWFPKRKSIYEQRLYAEDPLLDITFYNRNQYTHRNSYAKDPIIGEPKWVLKGDGIIFSSGHYIQKNGIIPSLIPISGDPRRILVEHVYQQNYRISLFFSINGRTPLPCAPIIWYPTHWIRYLLSFFLKWYSDRILSF